MGGLRGSYTIELRIHVDPNNKDSDYDVFFPVSIWEAIFDGVTGESLKGKLQALTSSKQDKVKACTCATAAATAAKVVTIADYTLTAGELFAVAFTAGNTANSPTINVNSTGAKQVRLGGGQPTGASGTGAAYCAAGMTVLYYYDGTYYHQLGSTDISDANDTWITNVYGATGNVYKVVANTQGGTQVHYALIGVCPDGTIDKITATASGVTAAGARTFTANKVSLLDNVMFLSSTTGAWTAGAAQATAAVSRCSIGTANWKYAVGEYYNRTGVLTANSVTTDLVQTPLFIGGTRDGDYFTSSEFSLTPRDPALVYKRIGYFGSTGNFYLSDYQPVFAYDGAWVSLYDASYAPKDATLIDAAANEALVSASKTSIVGFLQGIRNNIKWLLTKIYQKPAAGIPKSDLDSGVQASLSKADTALQSFAESDPTVPSWAKAASKPTYTASEVGALAANAEAISAAKLGMARTIDGVAFDGSVAISRFAVCASAAATAAKTVSVTGFSLITGARVTVKFTNGNSAENPTLNINSTGARSIYYQGAAIPAAFIRANGVYDFVYTGSYFDVVGNIALGYGY